MLFDHISKTPPFPTVLNTGAVDRVTLFKLLGVIITDNLSWENHVNAVCAKADTRLHFLKLLKRSSGDIRRLATILQSYHPASYRIRVSGLAVRINS